MTKFDSKLSKQILDRFAIAQEALAPQLKDETNDLKFKVDQWPENIRAAREGSQGGGAQAPPRPCLTVPQLEQPVDLVINRMQQAHLALIIRAISEESGDDTAEVYEDIIRSIERDSTSNPINWAFRRSTEAGRGWYRLGAVWDDTSTDPLATFDQKLIFQRILNQENVLVDPAAQEYDLTDMRYAFVVAWLPLEEFKAQFPNSEAAKGDYDTVADFAADCTAKAGPTRPAWVDLSDSKGVQIAEYWTRDVSYEKWVLFEVEEKDLNTGQRQIVQRIMPDSEKPEGVKVLRERDREIVKVTMRKVAPGGQGIEILETVAWDGKYIPLIPTFGKELIPFDGMRRFKGIIRDAIDPCRMTDYFASTATEIVAIERPQGPLVEEGQIEGYEDIWKTLGTVTHAYVPFKTTNIDGKPTTFVPQRMQADTSKLTMAISMLAQSKEWVQGSTQTPEAALGQVDAHRSGRAIQKLQEQSAMSQDGYLQNLQNITLPCAGKMLVDLIPHKYDRPGRIARIYGADEKARTIMLNAPFTMKDGEIPQRVDEQAVQVGQTVKHYDLAKGAYGVSVTVGQNYPTRKAEGAVELGELMKMSPEAMILIAPEYFQFSDVPGAQQLSDLFKKLRNFKFPWLAKKEDGETPTPDELQAEFDACKAELEQTKAQLAEAAKMIETEQVQAQAELEKVKAQGEITLAKAKMDAESKASIEGSQAGVDKQLQAIEDAHETQIKRMEQAFEERMLALEHAFTAHQAELDRVAEEKKARFAAEQAHAMAERSEAQADLDRDAAADAAVSE